MQSVLKDEGGVLRFRPNAIVRALLDRSDLEPDDLVTLDPSAALEDHVQILQLLGCPVDDPRVSTPEATDLPETVVLKKGYQPQPMQPIAKDDRGVLRFRENTIISLLLDRDSERGQVYPDFPARSDGGLNWIAVQNSSQEDREQFAQLIGYSISGYHELSYVSDASAAMASAHARAIMPGAGGCRDTGCSFHGGPINGKSCNDD